MSDGPELELGCKVSYGLGKRGTVRYVGETDFAQGEWVGLELDRPDGKNNGELNGRVYFTCADNHGLFVKRSQIRGVLSRPSSSGHATPTRRLSGVGTASRAQDTGDRRLSGVSARSQDATERRLSSVSSRLRPPSAGTAPAPSSLPRAATASARPSSGGALPTRSALRSSIAVPPSSSSAASAAASGMTPPRRVSSVSARLSLDDARRSPITRVPSSASDDQLVEANARIAKLEEELEQKNRHVEQLKQNVTVLKETAAKHEEEAKHAAEQQEEEQESVRMETDDQDGEQHEEQEEAMEVDEDAAMDDSPSPEALLAQQIEAVRQEAEDHVRSVRSELEDHIAQLQSEHDEVVDELRLENATQVSDIKALEAEIAQQKARIAQFTASEQKKAEEVALAVAKSSKGERKAEALQEQITELQDMVEMMTLEKETLEMDKEIAEERVEELQQEVDKLKATIALAAAAPERQDGEGPSSSEIADENRKLRAAVKALHERSSEEKAELSKKVRQLQRENSELTNLREEVEQLVAKRNKLESEAEELKEMLDVANAYESMVEDLTEKNLTLGDKMAELEATVQSLESLREVDQEVEHQHNEYEAELRDEIEAQRATMHELKQSLSDQKTAIDDKDRTIARFRDLTHSNREEIDQLKAKLRSESGELESLKGTTHMALNQTMNLRTLAAAAREFEIEAAKQKLNSEQARLESTSLRSMIPSSIFTGTDEKVLRVRLLLGRIAGKADILLQSVRKNVESSLQQATKEDGAGSGVDILELLLGDKLAAVFCQAQEDRFMLDCHITTEEEFTDGISQLDTIQIGTLESVLDAGLASFLDGTLLVARSGESSVCQRLIQISDDWLASRHKATSSSNEGFPARSAVVKLRSRRDVASVCFSLCAAVTGIRSAKLTVVTPGSESREELKTMLVPAFDGAIDELLAVINVAQLFYRRAEIDLAPSVDDLDGLVAVGGDVVEMTRGCSSESQGIWSLVHDNLTAQRIQERSTDELVAFVQQSLATVLSSFKDKIVTLFKVVCRGAFTDAVAPRSERAAASAGKEGRSQWQVRAQAIHSELLGASTLRVKLNEATELYQALHTRIREMERAESQTRVVTQKLESDVLRLNGSLTQATEEKSQMEAQMAKEREQFSSSLDESHKDKVALDAANRELRKELQRAKESSSAASRAPAASAKASMTAGDSEAFRKAYGVLQDELHRVRSTLAKERLERVLGPAPVTNTRVGAESRSSKLSQATKELAKVSRQVKAELSMPCLVDLRDVSSSPRQQIVSQQLKQSKAHQSLTSLRSQIGNWMKEDGWGDDVVGSITRGENVFGWQPPEMERPPLLISRVTLSGGEASTASATIPLVLNGSDVQRLSRTLVC